MIFGAVFCSTLNTLSTLTEYTTGIFKERKSCESARTGNLEWKTLLVLSNSRKGILMFLNDYVEAIIIVYHHIDHNITS